MSSAQNQSEIVVIYDGECDFCKECVRWVQKRATITALPFQTADLARYGVTYQRCSKEVVVIIDGKVSGGADAVASLLSATGHKVLGNSLKLTAPIARKGYSWVATHRESWVIRLATGILKRL
jgi:predicted DCC family thiol-disulfide oxidoreductase YuxK